MSRTTVANCSSCQGTMMTGLELNEFRNSLENIRTELVYAYRGRRLPALDTNLNMACQSRDGRQRILPPGFADHDTKMLYDVQSALNRLDAGTFGICLGCKREMSLKELAAMPWLAWCIVCQVAGTDLTAAPFEKIRAGSPLRSSL